MDGTGAAVAAGVAVAAAAVSSVTAAANRVSLAAVDGLRMPEAPTGERREATGVCWALTPLCAGVTALGDRIDSPNVF